jgi:Flp pilus assembly protein TadD
MLLCLLLLAAAGHLAAQHDGFRDDGLRGIRLYNQNRLTEARVALERAVESGTASVREMTVLGMTYTRLGQEKEARSVLEKAQDLDPFDPLVHIALGTLAFQLRDFPKAYHHFQLSDRFNPGSERARAGMVASLVNSALVLHADGKGEQAEARLLEAHRIDPEAPVVLYNLGVLARERGDLERAAAYLEEAVRLVPENAEAFVELGALYTKLGKSEAAEGAFRRAVALDTEEPLPYYYLATHALADETARRSHGDAEGATALSVIRSHLHSAIAKAIRKGDLVRMQAAKAVSGKKDSLSEGDLEALSELSKAAEKPRHILQDSIALLEQSFDEPQAFMEDVERLQRWYPHNLDLGLALGRLLVETGRLDKARRHWTALIEDYPTAADAHLGMADTLMALGDAEAARVAYQRARDLAPEQPEIYEALRALHEPAQGEEALVSWYRELYERERGNVVLLDALASLEEELGYAAEAELHRRRARRIREARQ